MADSDNIQLIASFVSYLKAERGAGENTTVSYEHAVRKFAEWFEEPLGRAQRSDLRLYLSEALTAGGNGRTAAHHLSCLRNFYHFLIDEGVTRIDPTRNLPVPKSWKTVPKAVSLAEVNKMVASLGSSWLGIRDRAMLLTFFASGLRESELADLKLQDVDLDAGAAKVWDGKGGKDGIVPLSPPAVAALRDYIENVRPSLARKSGDPRVFLGRYGKQLTRMAIFYRVRDISEAAIGRRISPHALRHGFATAMIEGGADVRDVQVLMRHASVDTTQIYVHTDLKYLRKVYYDTHPRARNA